ncbi:MAG: helix-turn-helix transcriptional regulator [Clostridia bacterium]|nr:helix-turn-helix transcriptional regulator [Clostridia bacterium]
MTFGETFKYYRKNAGYKQEEVAGRLMVTPQAVSKWETGAGTPDISLLVPIADMFGVTTDALLGNAKKSKEEIMMEIEKINSFWDEASGKDENYGEKYGKYLVLLKNNPDSPELLHEILVITQKWLANCSAEMSVAKKRELLETAEKIATKLCQNPEDVYGTHCLMCEIYFRCGETEKEEAEMAYFSQSGQYTKNRAKYMHLVMQKKHEEAAPHIENSLYNTLHWLVWDMNELAMNYYSLGDRENMCKVFEIEHGLLGAVGYYGEDFALWHIRAAVRLAQRAAQKKETEECFARLEEMMQIVRKWQKQDEAGKADEHILFARTGRGKSVKFSKELVLPMLEWKAFDYIRETERFGAVLAELDALDKQTPCAK